ncbi:MAG: ATP-dependent helicase [Candidatus Melainabacteria bacterium]
MGLSTMTGRPSEGETTQPHQPNALNLTEGLNPRQQEAVTHPMGPLLVMAGAGSGKTRVLTHKIAWQIQQGIYPGDILGVTFTNKAAKEMRLRLEALMVRMAGETFGKTYAQALWIGTFHSICGRILRRDIAQYVNASGRQWQQNFVIYDETETITAMKEVIQALNLDIKLYTPKNIRYLISGLKNQLQDAHTYAGTATDYKTEKLAQIFDGYEALLHRNNALDFDDMLLMTVRLLQNNPEVLARYHERFKHVLVDEFQDTNDVQYELVRLLVEGTVKGQLAKNQQQDHHDALWRTRSLTVVGDVDQSIYSWRGANFRILLNFQKDFPDASIIKLEDNYRSTEHILEAANAIIDNNTERMPKTLRAVKGLGEKLQCYEAQDDRDEAFFVIDRLMEQCGPERYKPGQCCILYRTNVQSRVLEDVLISRGIPYVMVGGLKFYERREIKDLLAYLTVLFNDQDNYSVKRILNVPKRGIGKTTIEKLEALANQEGVSLYSALARAAELGDLRPSTLKAIASFRSLMDRLKGEIAQHAIDSMLVTIADETGYFDELKNEDPTDAEGRQANVEEFISVARQFHVENPEGNLADFLTQMALLSDIDSAEPVENKLVLMTMHAAKGLEFPVVAICGLEEGLFPHFRSLNDKEGMEEERRLMYVGVTRAEDKLFLTYARRRLLMGEFRYAQPSRFLREIPPHRMAGVYSLDEESRHETVTTLRQAPRRGAAGGAKSYGPRDPWADGDAGSGVVNPNLSPNIRVHKANSTRAQQIRNTGAASAAAAGPVQSFTVGERVTHAKFGEGTVRQVLGDGAKAIVGIQFDTIAGLKLLDPKMAKLQKN